MTDQRSPSPATVCMVTGYITLNSAHKRHEAYLRWGERLLSVGVPTIAFFDRPWDHEVFEQVDVVGVSLEECWYRSVAEGAALPSGANPQKDTLNFFAVMQQKSEWLALAAMRTNADLLVWIDFGILHVPGVTEQHISDFLARLPRARTDVITLPTIWGILPLTEIDLNEPCWSAAGGVLIVPRALAGWFAAEVRRVAEAMIRGGEPATWEVNTWAAVASAWPDRFTTYHCDHDATLFDAFRP